MVAGIKRGQQRHRDRREARRREHDAVAAGERVNERYATINKNGVINSRFGGWPAKPYKYNRPGTRIDYVFAKGVTPVRYELFLRLRGDAFDERYRASDHNPVVTTWALPT